MDSPLDTNSRVPVIPAPDLVAPQSGGSTCSCGGGTGQPPTPPTFVYALGRIEARFPSPGVEREFLQATARAETAGKTDHQTFQSVLSQPQNRYLARKMCWVLKIEGLETYLLLPRDTFDLELLLQAIRPTDSPSDLDLVIGVKGPIAPPEACNGLMVPIIFFDQIYSFDRETLLSAIPKPDTAPATAFKAAASELLDRLLFITDNAGASDDHRALNYLAVRYPAVYALVAERHEANASLSGVEVRSSTLSGTRKVVEVIFSFTHRSTDVVDKYLTRVDVTERFPFLVTKLSPYYQI